VSHAGPSRTSRRRSHLSFLKQKIQRRTEAGVLGQQERTTEQKIASGRTEWTPVAVLGSVFGVIALLVVVVVALAALAYFLA